MQARRGLWLAGTGAVLTAAALALALSVGPNLLVKFVVSNVVLSDDSEALRRWKVVPQPLNYYVYLFNVENPEAVAQGARPVVTEKGPYVYDLFKEKVDVKFHPEDDTVSYFDKTHYRFNQNKSGCRSQDDLVTVLNAPVLGTGLTLQKMMEFALPLFNDAIPSIFPGATSAFVTARVREVLFDGILVNCSFPLTDFPVGPVCQGMRKRAPVTFRKDGKNYYFSLFNHLNGTDLQHRVRVSRGQRDYRSLGRIASFGNGSLHSAWRPGTPCNMINGTDSTIFHPFISPPEKIPVFVSGSCRSMYVTYQYPVQAHGVRALHFVADPKMLASGRTYLPNRCFCPPAPEDDQEGAASALPPPVTARPATSAATAAAPGTTAALGTTAAVAEALTSAAEAAVTAAETTAPSAAPTTAEDEFASDEPTEMGARRRRDVAADRREQRDASTCLPDGSLDMTTCFGSPVILTLPHFYLGASEFSDYAIGLKADRAKHETFVDIEPNTGVPLRGGKRVQLNMFLKKIDKITALSRVSEGLMPILWVEEGIDLEGDSLDQMLAASRRIALVRVLPWVLAAAAVLVTAVGVVLHVHSTGVLRHVVAPPRGPHSAASGGAQGHDGPPLGPPPGNYGIALGFGPPPLTVHEGGHKGKLLGVGEGGGGGGGWAADAAPFGLHSLRGLDLGSADGPDGPPGRSVLLGKGEGGGGRVVVRTFCGPDPHHDYRRSGNGVWGH